MCKILAAFLFFSSLAFAQHPLVVRQEINDKPYTCRPLDKVTACLTFPTHMTVVFPINGSDCKFTQDSQRQDVVNCYKNEKWWYNLKEQILLLDLSTDCQKAISQACIDSIVKANDGDSKGLIHNVLTPEEMIKACELTID